MKKIEKYIKILELTFEQLYESEFEKEEHNFFLSKNIPLDWIIWYDSYNHKFRDALYSYGYRTGYIQQITLRIQNVKIKRD